MEPGALWPGRCPRSPNRLGLFTTKGDNRVWALDVVASTLTIVYDDSTSPTPILAGVDNVTVAQNGDVLVAEDGGDMQICLLRNGAVSAILQVVGQDSSEITGPAFDPSGSRLYFSSQRGPAPSGAGITYEVTGPFASAGGRRAAGGGRRVGEARRLSPG